MQHHRLMALIAIFVFLSLPSIVSAASFGINRAFGGRVLSTTPTPLVTCTAIGPIFGQSFIPGVPGPYFIRTATSGIARSGGYILGMYRQVPDLGSCFNPETGIPVPAYEFIKYGVSRF